MTNMGMKIKISPVNRSTLVKKVSSMSKSFLLLLLQVLVEDIGKNGKTSTTRAGTTIKAYVTGRSTRDSKRGP